MNSFYFGFVLFLASAPWVFTQQSATPAEPSSSVSASAPVVKLSEAQLQELMGPVALYPDALIALILPASTEPTEIVLAARYLAAKKPTELIDREPWSESIKGLARYPGVVARMDTNLDWTRQVGDAFVAQPADVMNAVQHLRARARAVGTLTDTPEQRVVVEEQIIRIEPARVDVLYVPRYDPEIIYVTRPLGLRSSFITFGHGYSTGIWLSNACDWHHRTVVVLDHRHRAPYYHRPFHPVYNHRNPRPGFHRWTPHRPRVRSVYTHPSRSHIVRPAPIDGTPDRRKEVRPSRREDTRPDRVPPKRVKPDKGDDDRRKRSSELRRSSGPESRIVAPAVTVPSTPRWVRPQRPVVRAPVVQRPVQRRADPPARQERVIRRDPPREHRSRNREVSERTQSRRTSADEKQERARSWRSR